MLRMTPEDLKAITEIPSGELTLQGRCEHDAVEAHRLQARVADLELTLTISESAQQDYRREIEGLKDHIRELYRLRGEDPVVAGICNRALA